MCFPRWRGRSKGKDYATSHPAYGPDPLFPRTGPRSSAAQRPSFVLSSRLHASTMVAYPHQHAKPRIECHPSTGITVADQLVQSATNCLAILQLKLAISLHICAHGSGEQGIRSTWQQQYLDLEDVCNLAKISIHIHTHTHMHK